MSLTDAPQPEEVEISLIGTGGGYGESLVVHLGDNKWMVVDSCIDPINKKCLPLEYLQNLNVGLENILIIVITHWHDDHILGISELLLKCKNAELCFSRVNDRSKFLRFVQLDYLKLKREGSLSSTKEFNECLEIMKERKSQIRSASANQVLKKIVNSTFISEVISLSPSDFTIDNFTSEISTLITDFGSSNKKTVVKSPNSKSVALFLRLGEHKAILGADLEVTLDSRDGWLNVLNENTVIDGKSKFYKVAHHGSENGFHKRIFTELLMANPITGMTPWNRKSKLPEIEMLKNFCKLSTNVYLTSSHVSDKPKKRSKNMEKLISRFRSKLKEVKYQQGIIRSRINAINKNAEWAIEIFDSAVHANLIIK